MAGTFRVPSSPPFMSNNLRCGWNVPERTSRHRLMHRLPSSLTDDSNSQFSVFLGPAARSVPLRLLLLVESFPRLSLRGRSRLGPHLRWNIRLGICDLEARLLSSKTSF